MVTSSCNDSAKIISSITSQVEGVWWQGPDANKFRGDWNGQFKAQLNQVKSAFAAAQSAYSNIASINRQIYDTVEKTVEQNVATAQAATEPKRAKKR